MRERIIRFLSPTERIWLVADNLGSPFVITIVVEGAGARPALLQSALARAAAANPGARAQLRGGLRPYRWVVGEQEPIVTELRAAPQPGAVAGTRLLDHAPGLELGVAPGPVLVFRVHHALMDGRGLLHFVEEVFRALRGEALLGGDDGLTDTMLAEKLPATSLVTKARSFVGPTGQHQGSIQSVWGKRRMLGSWHHLLPLVAVAVSTHARRFDAEAHVRLQIPVDLRRYAGQTSTSNLTGIATIDPAVGATVADISSALTESLAADAPLRWVRGITLLGKVPLCLLRHGSRKKVAQATRTSRFSATAVLSNLGRVDLHAFDAPDFEARRIYWIPPCGPATAAAFGLVGDGAAVELSAALPAGLASEGRLDELLDAIVQDVRSH